MGRRRRVVVGLVASIAMFVMVACGHPSQTNDDGLAAMGPTAHATVPSPPASAPTTSAASSSSATVPVTPTVAPPVVIHQAEPTRIAIPAIGYDAPVTTMTTDANGDVDPPELRPTYRITDRGAAPGTDADNTVYMACHSWSKGDAPCNVVSQRAAVGQHVFVTTPNGTLDYVIQETKTYSKDGEFKNSPEVRAIVPGRLVHATCLLGPHGETTNKNFVIFAQLVAGTP